MKYLIKSLGLIIVICFYNNAIGQLRNENYSKERMFLHTDKNTYLAGEIGWFKLYNTDAATKLPSDISKIAYIELLDNNNAAVIQEKIALSTGKGNGSLIFPKSLPSGIYILRAYSNWMKNEGSDVFFEKSISIYNTKMGNEPKSKWQLKSQGNNDTEIDALQIGVKLNKTYTTRDKIEIAMNVQDQSGNPTDANLSMSIYKIDDLQVVDSMNITNSLSHTSNLTVESIKFLPEYAGHIITGTILNTKTQQPLSEALVYCSVPGINTQFKTSLSDRNGNFKFEMPNLYNEGQIIVQPGNGFSQINKIIINNPFVPRTTKNNLLIGDSIGKALLLDRHIDVEVQDYYTKAKQHSIRAFSFDTSSFYYKADRTYLLDNFVRFSTLEEVIREYVTPISLTKKKGLFVMNVYDEEQKQFFETNPLVMLNGVPILNVNKLMDYDPLKIKKLDVIMRTYYYGNTSFNGVINFITYDGKIEDETLIPDGSIFDYDGIQKERDFYAPIYESSAQKETSMPDFRTTLQWVPNIDIPASGIKTLTIFSSDLPGKYIISLQGINKEGKTGSRLVPFEVTLK